MQIRQMSALPSIRFSSGSFVAHELEEYAESIVDLWDAEIDQTAVAEESSQCRYVTDGAAVLYEERLGADNLQRGSLRGDRIAIALSNEVARGGRWMGRTVGSSGLAFARGGDEIELMFPAGSENRVAVLDWEPFAASLEVQVGRSAERLFPRNSFFLNAFPGRGRQVRERWGDWIRGATTPSHDLAGSLVESVAMLLPPGTNSSGRERRADAPTFRRVIDRLQGGELPNGPGRLAEAMGISLRTLHNACRYGSGHSPGQLIRAIRMNRVRRDLFRFGPDERTVAELAIAHGFNELGRFAGEYRRVFGELPSQTLRRRDCRKEMLRVGWS